MLETLSRKFPFTDDLALAIQTNLLSAYKGLLTHDLKTMDEYYTVERLYLNPGKTVTCTFQLNNHDANETLNVKLNREIRYNKEPMSWGSKVDRSLTHQPLVEKLC